MGKSARVTVVLSDDLSAAIERARKHTGQSRSAFIRNAVELVVDEEQRQAKIERYVQGYRAIPESEDEIREAVALSYASLAEEPWS